MSPAPMAGLAYWACGGDVHGRSGPLTRERADEVATFLDRQVAGWRDNGDPAAIETLFRMAHDLHLAIASAEDWRRAAGGLNPTFLRV